MLQCYAGQGLGGCYNAFVYLCKLPKTRIIFGAI